MEDAAKTDPQNPQKGPFRRTNPTKEMKYR